MNLLTSLLQNDYRFVTHWQVKGSIDEVFEILKDSEALSRWWPAVYLNTDVLKAGDKNGIGQIVDLFTKGWLPYTLSWLLKVTEVHKPNTIKFEAWGDLSGQGTWKLSQKGPMVDIVFDWRVQLQRPILKYLTFALTPIFEANHKWAMKQGLLSLKLELARRHAKSADELKRIPAPPGPTTTSALPLLAALGVGFVLVWTTKRWLDSFNPDES
jgi:hypothetical protein